MKFDDYEKDYFGIYNEFAAFVRTLLKNAIAETKGLPRLQSTKSRAKTAESLKVKLEGRSLLASDRIEAEIKDLAGVRLIFYTETDVDRFIDTRLIPELLDWKETKVHHPTEGNDPRYKAFHYVVSLRKKQEALPEYEKFKGMRCEIQIQTVLNHAWAETYHDMIYKARGGDGFGTNAREALDKRMKKVMDEHLRPASYEFQKCQHDHERLMQGKALFDRGALETMEKCDNNNDRHEILSTLSEHVIPNYDDIPGVYPDICRALEAAVHAARNTETKPIESVFGNLPGKMPKDVTLLAIGIFNDLRYADVEVTLRSLISIYKGEKDKEVRKQIIEAVKRLANYNLHVWKQAGPYVQGVLADTLEKFSKEELAALRPIILTIWRELLGSDMEGSKFSADIVAVITFTVLIIIIIIILVVVLIVAIILRQLFPGRQAIGLKESIGLQAALHLKEALFAFGNVFHIVESRQREHHQALGQIGEVITYRNLGMRIRMKRIGGLLQFFVGYFGQQLAAALYIAHCLGVHRFAISGLQLRMDRFFIAFDGETAVAVTFGKNNTGERDAARCGKKMRHGMTLLLWLHIPCIAWTRHMGRDYTLCVLARSAKIHEKTHIIYVNQREKYFLELGFLEDFKTIF